MGASAFFALLAIFVFICDECCQCCQPDIFQWSSSFFIYVSSDISSTPKTPSSLGDWAWYCLFINALSFRYSNFWAWVFSGRAFVVAIVAFSQNFFTGCRPLSSMAGDYLISCLLIQIEVIYPKMSIFLKRRVTFADNTILCIELQPVYASPAVHRHTVASHIKPVWWRVSITRAQHERPACTDIFAAMSGSSAHPSLSNVC